jgi:hypothetical protein
MLTQRVIEELEKALPPVFAGTSVDELTGGAINWATVQNRRCKREIPDACFVRSGNRVLVIREPFLNWFKSTLRDARQPFGKPARATPPTPRAGRKKLARSDTAAASPIAIAAAFE